MAPVSGLRPVSRLILVNAAPENTFKAGEKASAAVLEGREATIAIELSALESEELVLLATLAERVLRARLRDYRQRIWRL